MHSGSYLICATPRTGSTLLCSLLDSTGVAGHPDSYFRAPDEQDWAMRWGVARSSDGTVHYDKFVQAAIAAGRTGNDVFAARIMWGTLDEVAVKLAPFYPSLAGSPTGLLNFLFGHPRFVYLRRGDVLAQAVSLLRAEQTSVWHQTGPVRQVAERAPRFDFDQIRKRIELIEEDNRAWQRWFAAAGIEPYPVQYEELAADPVGTARGVLDYLGLALPADREITAENKRLADALNAQWISAYQHRETVRQEPS